jgi:DNA-binding MarR family transcriptional regulator
MEWFAFDAVDGRSGARRARRAVSKPAAPSGERPGGVQWLSDLIRLEIVLWERVDARLREKHDLPFTFFEPLHFIEHSPGGGLRIGDLAQALRITVGGTSKLADRIERAGLIRREPDPDDRRASRVALTDSGRRTLAAAVETYEAELAHILDPELSEEEQRAMHDLVTRLLTATSDGERA